MTLQEALLEGVRVTGIGLSIVFAVLVILMLVMVIMKKVFYKEPSVKEKTVTVTPVALEPEENEDELIAVLTAAVAASLNTSTYNLKIKSYKRVQNQAPSWNKAGIAETINGRF